MNYFLSSLNRFSRVVLFSSIALSKPMLFAMDPQAGGEQGNMALKMRYNIVPKKLNAANIKKIEDIIGYQFKNKKLLKQALTTKDKDPANNYERDEYLGDTVLEVAIADMLLQDYPKANPGDLTSARTALVSQEPMAALCLRLELHNYIQHSKQELPISTLCDIIESIIGVIYRDGGAVAAQDFTSRFFYPMIQGKKCPQSMSDIIRTAAKETKQNIEYKWQNGMWVLKKSAGDGKIAKDEVKKICNTKKDPVRFAEYEAQRAFILDQLNPIYQQSLVRLATDQDYQPLLKSIDVELEQEIPVLKYEPLAFGEKSAQKLPEDEPAQNPLSVNPVQEISVIKHEPMQRLSALSFDWKVGQKINWRVRFDTLMQKFGQKPAYNISENNESEDNCFVCTLDNHFLNKLITGAASSKTEAVETVAENAYKQIQKSIILSNEGLVCDGSEDIFDGIKQGNPVSLLQELCQKRGLDLPVYDPYVKNKNDLPVYYSWLRAPWLAKAIKGSSEKTVNASKNAVAARTVSIMKHISSSWIDPKKLDLFFRFKLTNNPVSMLHTWSNFCELAQPKMETILCEGPVAAEGISYKTKIIVADKEWGSKIFKGAKAFSKSEAESNAADKALIYLANKMLKREIQQA